MTTPHKSHFCTIVPPQILKKLLESDQAEIREAALNTLLSTARLRGARSVNSLVSAAAAPSGGRRTIFNLQRRTNLLTAVLARTEDGPAAADAAVNRAFDGLGATRDFFKKVLNRNSIDGRGFRLNGFVHRGVRFNNAFFDGRNMVFGDGDGVVFTDFTKSLDVIAHELTHGVTQFTANLEYHNQSGALNESISDVFGSLVKQWSKNQTAANADWLIGNDIFTPSIQADALRSMKAPGTAFDNDLFGRDPQPSHMDDFVQLPDDEDGDFGGVHINSGIPNKAFHLTAIGIGGKAWDQAGHIWYEALRASHENTDFQEFANTTFEKAGQLFGTNSNEQRVVADAWNQVGIRPANSAVGSSGRRSPSGRRTPSRPTNDTPAEILRRLESMSEEIRSLQELLQGCDQA